MIALILAVLGLTVPPAVSSEATVEGKATFYDDPGRSGLYAAAGPSLRKMLGAGWRGETVVVCHERDCVTVRIVDFCACGPRQGEPTVLDLSSAAFRRLGPLSQGVISVAVSAAPHLPLPPTDTAP